MSSPVGVAVITRSSLRECPKRVYCSAGDPTVLNAEELVNTQRAALFALLDDETTFDVTFDVIPSEGCDCCGGDGPSSGCGYAFGRECTPSTAAAATGRRRQFRAHRAVVAAHSPVFEAMLFGRFRESGAGAVVTVGDMDPDCFFCLLRYCYGGDPNVTLATACGVWAAADKFQIQPLMDLCDKFLAEYFQRHLREIDVCSILAGAWRCGGIDSIAGCSGGSDPCGDNGTCSGTGAESAAKRDAGGAKGGGGAFGFGGFGGENELVSRCLRAVATLEDCGAILRCDGFLRLPGGALRLLVASDDLEVDERLVWEACLRWADHQVSCGFAPTRADALAIVAGDVRFPLMPAEFFASLVVPEGVLGAEQALAALVHIVCPQRPSEFCARPRHNATRPFVLRRYGSLANGACWCYNGPPDVLCVQADKGCVLGGVGVFCSQGRTVAQIKVFEGRDALGDAACVGLSGEHVFDFPNAAPAEPVRLRLQRSVRLAAGVTYTLFLRQSTSGRTAKATGCPEEIAVRGVHFRFIKSSLSSNGTNVTVGALPLLYFQSCDSAAAAAADGAPAGSVVGAAAAARASAGPASTVSAAAASGGIIGKGATMQSSGGGGGGGERKGGGCNGGGGASGAAARAGGPSASSPSSNGGGVACGDSGGGSSRGGGGECGGDSDGESSGGGGGQLERGSGGDSAGMRCFPSTSSFFRQATVPPAETLEANGQDGQDDTDADAAAPAS
ncbi:unnamed protein product [Phaeothamnion confervicola]